MKPTILLTFDAPELETGFEVSDTFKGHSVFSMVGFTGKVKFYKESFKILSNKRLFLSNLLSFFAYFFLLFFHTIGIFKVPTVFDLLKKYNVKTTFFGVFASIDPNRKQLNELHYNPAVYRRILREGHELGLHGYLHRELSEDDLKRSLYLSKKILGVGLKTYSSPWGKDSKKTEELLKKYRFLGWRVYTSDTDLRKKPYKVRYKIKLDDDLLDSIVKKGRVMALNVHMPDIYPFGIFKFKKLLKKIKKRNIWTPTFSEFCTYVDSLKHK